MPEKEILIEAKNIKKHFPVKRGMFERPEIQERILRGDRLVER